MQKRLMKFIKYYEIGLVLIPFHSNNPVSTVFCLRYSSELVARGWAYGFKKIKLLAYSVCYF